MASSTEIEALDNINATLQAQLTDLNSNVIPALEDSVRDMDTSFQAELDGIKGNLDTLGTQLGSLLTAIQEINSNIQTLTTAFGDVSTQEFTDNIQDIRDDTREGLQMSKEALRRANLPRRISGSS